MSLLFECLIQLLAFTMQECLDLAGYRWFRKECSFTILFQITHHTISMLMWISQTSAPVFKHRTVKEMLKKAIWDSYAVFLLYHSLLYSKRLKWEGESIKWALTCLSLLLMNTKNSAQCNTGREAKHICLYKFAFISVSCKLIAIVSCKGGHWLVKMPNLLVQEESGV